MSYPSSRIFSQNKLFSRVRPATIFAVIILTALAAFELFNYSTTEYALKDLLGNLQFFGLNWATILSIAFCGIDFAGIARLFTPEQGAREPKEVWYLLGAWLLAGCMNAILTWWGVSMAIVNHTVTSSSIIDHNTLFKVVPIFVALMVWVIRILIIGTISMAGERFLWGSASRNRSVNSSSNSVNSSRVGGSIPAPRPVTASPRVVMPRPASSQRLDASSASSANRGDPTYHSMSMSARPSVRGNNDRNLDS
jgi:hypothetical protein